MRKIIFFTFCSFILSFSVIADCNAAILMTFDDLTLGDYGSSFWYKNVTISTYPTSHLQVTDSSSDGLGKAHSLPNKLSVWGEQPWVPMDKTSFSLLFDYPVSQVNFWLTGTFHDTTVNAYDKEGGFLMTFTQTYPMNGPVAPDGRPWDYYYDDVLRNINIEAPDIRKITIQPSAYDHFSIDDVNYVGAVPEPPTALLFAPAIAVMAVVLKRRLGQV